MPSLIPGFEYDIFISYRQKDNKGDHWVTEFVSALKAELDATFKEDISIFFDENPHDGLQEHHDVDESLKEKLKCLLFIPILSRTYCDPKSFAFEQEFKVFVNQTSKDSYGLKVKLAGGNVASRVLPVRIHELSKEDIDQFQQVTGSALRSVDFVYHTSGVNRPLRPREEHPDSNQYPITYLDQLNKVANAIEAIIGAMRADPTIESTTAYFSPGALEGKNIVPAWKKWPKYAAGLLLVIATILVGLNIPKWLSTPEERSIVVLPFKNLSPDPQDQYLAEGFHEEIINRLGRQKNLMVIAQQSSNLASQFGLSFEEISEKLRVQFILTGSIRKAGDDLRITTQLVDAASGKVVDSKTLDRKLKDYFAVQKEVADKVVTDVGITVSRSLENQPEPNSIKALEYLKRARRSEFSGNEEGRKVVNREVIELIEMAILEDSMYLDAWALLQDVYLYVYINGGDSTTLLGGQNANKKINSIDKHGYQARIMNVRYLYQVEKRFDEVIALADELLESVPNNLEAMQIKALALKRKGEYQECINTLMLSLRLDPLARWAKIEIVQILLPNFQTDLAKRFIDDLKGDFYHSYVFSSAVIDNKLSSLDLIINSAKSDSLYANTIAYDFFVKTANATKSVYTRNYVEALKSWPAAKKADSALFYFMQGDTNRCTELFGQGVSFYRKLAASTPDIQSAKSLAMQGAICLAGLKRSNWESEFARIREGLIPFRYGRYYQNYVIACIVSGKRMRAIELLTEWQKKNSPVIWGTGPCAPFDLLLKNHPLLDPLRDEPGFEELWEGNHMKLKKLRVATE